MGKRTAIVVSSPGETCQAADRGWRSKANDL